MSQPKSTVLPGSVANGRTEEPGRRLKRIRERLNLTYREVEEASMRIARRHNNCDEFNLGLSRLSDIENKGTIPTLYRLYSLCAIYRLDFVEALSWYGVDLAELPTDSLLLTIERTHPIHVQPGSHGEVQFPLSLDPGIDLSRTTHLSRVIQRWGKLPLMLLNGLDLENHQYAFIGSEDWSMYPLLMPGSLVLVDETRKKIAKSGWTDEYDRPIYFLEHRDGYAVGWCSLVKGQLVVMPHPASPSAPEVYAYPRDIEVVGQVVGVAMRLDPGRQRHVRASTGAG
jgi:transcriptional regulator with XRE-family HTH domain